MDDHFELKDAALETVSGGGSVDTEELVIKTVRGILSVHLELPESSIGAQSRIIDDLGADSLDVVDVVSSAEVKLNVRIDRSQFERISTVEDLCLLLLKSL